MPPTPGFLDTESYRALSREHPDVLEHWVILMGWRGSVAHDMYVPGSDPSGIDDKDLMSVCVPPLEHYLGLKEFGSRGTREILQGEWDVVAYEARKFIRLLAQGNPNVLSLLWVRDEHLVTVTSAGRRLLDQRRLFLGRHLYHSFVGYAQAQLKKMTHLAFQGYMGEKRKKLVERHGYDTKNAAHVIRLLRMGIEVLRDGELRVFRPDAEELLNIKKGGWPLDRVKAEADALFQEAARAHRDSPLPAGPDKQAVSALAVEVIQEALGIHAADHH